MIKKYNLYLKEDVGYEEEPDDDKLCIIGWEGYNKIFYGDKKEYCLERDGMIYILQEIIDYDTIILYEDFKHRVFTADGIESKYTILSQEELKKYIYSDGAQVSVRVVDRGGDHFIPYYWSDLPQEIKDLL